MIKTCYNLSQVVDCDEWICSHCGINLAEWVRVVMNEENDTLYYEYTFKFCPECGHKVVSKCDK